MPDSVEKLKGCAGSRSLIHSGASSARLGYQTLLADLDRAAFDVVVVEALDRLGRKLADIAQFFDRLSFLGLKLHSIANGEITTMHIGGSA